MVEKFVYEHEKTVSLCLVLTLQGRRGKRGRDRERNGQEMKNWLKIGKTRGGRGGEERGEGKEGGGKEGKEGISIINLTNLL